ncbi:5209_t:CDS:2 [Ambispora gerdemannii]|uniref:5209_t:CDS:1 n=1 Tax=Ambispora gerdemannii TaxID=144530 RepID=A0A9N8ZYR2_9GLOM|nr:5209_t:CDS:2 [Ambispora gerdemannii]
MVNGAILDYVQYGPVDNTASSLRVTIGHVIYTFPVNTLFSHDTRIFAKFRFRDAFPTTSPVTAFVNALRTSRTEYKGT